MEISRPLSKEQLKKIILKCLSYNESKPTIGHDDEGIMQLMVPGYLGIQYRDLSTTEDENGRIAIHELEQDGFIMPDPTQRSKAFKVLTEKGKRHAKETLENMTLPSIDIEKIITSEQLLNKVRSDYSEGEYDSAIFKAFKLVEIAVRNKSELPPSLVGADLMNKAFNSKKTILEHPNAQTQSEIEGLFMLFRGSISWFKNPHSHRDVDNDDSVQTAQILAFADLLLNIISQCKVK